MQEIDDDFGFTIVDQTELTFGQDALTSQLQQLYNAIIPLLKNLKANPDKDTIVWPNRAVKIDEFKTKIDKIVGDTITKKKI
jgi:apolipoprotein N-acyltransferase